MAKNLVIVESPAKGKTIEKFLWKDYKVVASMWHFRDLPVKKIWVDIEDGFKPNYEISKDKKKTVDWLIALAKKAETVWIATDEDREGEAIGWHLCHILDLDPKETKRIVFHEITEKAIKHSIEEPTHINLDLVDAQQARRVLDRLVWYKISPVLWKKIRKWLSAGRVQSVAVKLIVEKEIEIRNFKPVESWKFSSIVEAEGKKFKVILHKISWKVAKLKTKEDATNIFKEILWEVELKESQDKKWNTILEAKKEFNLVLKTATKKESKKYPAPPFTTSTLQQEASRKFGYPLKKTMMVAQKLYEWIDLWNGKRQWLITYMRTDSVNLSDVAKTGAKKMIENLYWTKYSLANGRNYKTKSAWAQEAHEAIRPTDLERTPESLSWVLDKDQLKLYDLIWKRTLASQMKEALVEVTTFVFNNEDIKKFDWQAKWEVVKFDGFMKVYTEWKDDDDTNGEADNSILPDLKEWDIAKAKILTANQAFTRPPARYTEASLVKKLESEWIGRPSTYAPTITTIIDRGYIEKIEKKYLSPTEIAFVVTEFLEKYFAQMMDYKFTSKVEEDFDKIATGDEKYEEMLDWFWSHFVKDLENADENAVKQVEKIWKKCPDCWGELLMKYWKNWKFIACENFPECKYTEELEEERKKKEALEKQVWEKFCPKCGSILNIKNGRYGPFLACSSYPDCKHIESIKDPKQEILEEILAGEKCEKCESLMAIKNSKRWLFMACTGYPKCKNAKPIPKTAWDEVNERLKK